MGTLHTRGRSSSPPSDPGPGLPSPLLRWSAVRVTSLPLHTPPRSLLGSPPSTRSRFGVVVVGLQLGAETSAQSLVHWWVVEWLACLGFGLLVPQHFFFLPHTRRRLRPVGTAAGWVA